MHVFTEPLTCMGCTAAMHSGRGCQFWWTLIAEFATTTYITPWSELAVPMIQGLSFNNLRGDVYGGLVAAVVALPLALAFGVASGAGAIAGLYGAIFVGLFAALLGGTLLRCRVLPVR